MPLTNSLTPSLSSPVFRVHIPASGRVLLHVLSTASDRPAEDPVDLTGMLLSLLRSAAVSPTPPIEEESSASPFATISFPDGFRVFKDGRRIPLAEVTGLLEIAVQDALRDYLQKYERYGKVSSL